MPQASELTLSLAKQEEEEEIEKPKAGKGKGGKGGKEGKDSPKKPKAKEEIKGIPEFWATVLRNHPLVAETIQEHDLEIINFLEDVSIKYIDNNMAFTLEFRWAANQYFTNTVLTKSYYFQNNASPAFDDVIYARAEGYCLFFPLFRVSSLTIFLGCVVAPLTGSRARTSPSALRPRSRRTRVSASPFLSFFFFLPKM